jgi:hypothetical protein
MATSYLVDGTLGYCLRFISLQTLEAASRIGIRSFVWLIPKLGAGQLA